MSGAPTTTTAPEGSATSPAPEASRAEFVRIGLAGPAGRTDLAVPAAVPLARLLPMLLRQAGAEPGADGGAGHGGWVLCRDDGTRLAAAGSLAGHGVAEGELLFLRHGDDDATPPLYDDVVEVLGEQGVRDPWPAVATRRAAAALAVLALLTGCGALAVAPTGVAGWLGLAVAVLALAVGTLMSRGFDDARAGTFAALLAAPPGAVGAARLLGAGPGDGLTAGHLLVGCAVLAVVGVLGPVLVGGGDAAFAVLVVAGPLVGVGALLRTVEPGVTPAEAASVAAPLALALTTLLPAVALRVARVPTPQLAATAEELEQLPSQLAHRELTARVVAARRLAGGMLAGSLLVAAAGTLVLFAAGRPWAAVLGVVLTVLTLLRARLFRQSTQVATATLAALVAAAGGAVCAVATQADRAVVLLGVALPLTLVVALVAGGLALAAGRRRTNPRLAGTLDLLETLLLVSVVPLVLAVWDVYGALLDLRA